MTTNGYENKPFHVVVKGIMESKGKKRVHVDSARIRRSRLVKILDGLEIPGEEERNIILRAIDARGYACAGYWEKGFAGRWYFKNKYQVARTTHHKKELVFKGEGGNKKPANWRSQFMKARWASGQMDKYLAPRNTHPDPKIDPVLEAKRLRKKMYDKAYYLTYRGTDRVPVGGPTGLNQEPVKVSNEEVQQLSYKLLSEQIMWVKRTVEERALWIIITQIVMALATLLNVFTK